MEIFRKILRFKFVVILSQIPLFVSGALAAESSATSDLLLPELREILKDPKHQILIEKIVTIDPPMQPSRVPSSSAYFEILQDRDGCEVQVRDHVFKIHDPKIEAILGYDPLAVRLPNLSFKEKLTGDVIATIDAVSGLKIAILIEPHTFMRTPVSLELRDTTAREGLLKLIEALRADYLRINYLISRDKTTCSMFLVIKKIRMQE